MSDKTALGNRMKLYEGYEAKRKVLPLLPVIARMDGVGFSKFTKKMIRPYDKEMSNLMIETTKYLVKATGALIGYTQSDEISLVWYSDRIDSQIFNDGKLQKMVSKLASMTTAKFNQLLLNSHLHAHVKKDSPIFDARVWTVPNKEEAANALLWRELDATKNSISMAAQKYFSHKELMHKHTGRQKEMLLEVGVDWEDYPDFFKRGSFIQRVTVESVLSTDEIELIPHKNRPEAGAVVQRHEYLRLEMPPFKTVSNRVGVIFDKETPIVITE